MEARLECDLQDVNRNIIALPEDEVKRNNKILGEVVRDQILMKMQDNNPLFKFLYRNISYAGSFFCGLKVKHPDEYDLDFLLKLPEYLSPILSLCSTTGYVQVQLQGMMQFQKGSKIYPCMLAPLPVARAGNGIILARRGQNSSPRAMGAKKYWDNTGPTIEEVINGSMAGGGGGGGGGSLGSTVVSRARKRPPNPQKVHPRSRRLQSLWDNIRYNPDLNFLTKEQRLVLSDLVNLMDDDFYLDTRKVSAWFEAILNKTFNSFKKTDKNTFIKTSIGNIQVGLSESGPAFTLKLRRNTKRRRILIDIDLVPGFVFGKEQWPPSPFIPNPVPEKPEFFIVPKKPDKKGNVFKCWRPSFQEQESVLINNMQNFKPCIKLMKEIRDAGGHKKIASYHLKTIFLWELKENKNIWTNPLADVFMTMLEKCQKIFKNRVILNYWNKDDNLIKGLNEKTLDNIANNFEKIIKSIKNNPDNIFKFVEEQVLLENVG